MAQAPRLMAQAPRLMAQAPGQMSQAAREGVLGGRRPGELT